MRKETLRKYVLSIAFVLGILIAIGMPSDKVYAAGQTSMFIGETEIFSANINNYDTIKSYSWTISGSGAYVANKTAKSCQVVATSKGKVTLNYSITSTYTYYIYTDVQCTQKKWYTNTHTARASWEITIGDPITISFDGNGGSVSQTSKQVLGGSVTTYGDLPTAVRSGYIFDGWYTSASGGTLVTSSSTVSSSKNHTLYAHWIKDFEYTIHFDGNGSTGGTMEDISCWYGTMYFLPNNTFVKKGNRFVGWNTKSDGTGTTYKNQAAIAKLRKKEGTVTLYAKWDDSNIASGVWGDNYTWVIDPEGTLFVSGTGAMPDAPDALADRLKMYGWFFHDDKIKKIVIGEGITHIGNNAFCGFEELESIEMANTITSIGRSAFSACITLKEVELPDSVKTIGYSAFSAGWELSKVTLGKGVTYIADDAFGGGEYNTIHIPAAVTYIGEGAFTSHNLESFTVDKDNEDYTAVDGVLYDKAMTTLLQYPGKRSESVFTIPDGVVILRGESFVDARLNTLIIPSSLQTIGNACFYNVVSLKNIYFKGTPPTLAVASGSTKWHFYGMKATFHYPAERTSAWSSSVREEYRSAFFSFDATDVGLTWKSYTLSDSLQDCTVKRKDDTIYFYDGKEQKPQVEVYDGGLRLVEGTDYEVSYENNIGAGENTAKIIVTGLGHYEGTSNFLLFTIRKAQQTPIFSIASEQVTYGKKLTIENATGYGKITYSSDNTAVASVSAAGVISGLKVGTAVITITVAGDENHESGTETLNIEVTHDKTLAPTSITAKKTKVKTYLGEAISLKDLKVTANYADGYSKTVTNYKTNVDKIWVTKEGDKPLKISYTENGKTVSTTITLNVSHNPKLAPASITAKKTKVKVSAGDKISLSDLTVTAKYSDGYTQKVTSYKTNLKDISTSKIGDKTLKITYTENGKTVSTTVKITVSHNTKLAPTSITVKKTKVKTCVGEAIKLKDLTVTAKYADGYSKKVTNYKTNLAKILINKAGKKSLKISYTENGKTVSKTITLTVSKHTAGSAVIEKYKKATTKVQGTFYKVKYCKACKKELERKKYTIPKLQSTVKHTSSGGYYIVTKGNTSGGEVTFKAPINKKVKTYSIPSSITIGGLTYKVTAVAEKAFYKSSYLTTVTIPSTVTKIGKNAFYNCKKLSKITIKSKKLTTSNVGTNAFKGIKSTATINVPKDKYSSYKTLLKKRGAGTKVKYKKI